MGIGEAFAAFKDGYNIGAEKMSNISYRYRRITRQLNTDFWNTTSESAHSLYVGSYGRDTAARGLSDLDIGFVLPNTLYHQYHAYLGNGQSALLQAVKKSIQKTYTTSESFGDGQVVVIRFDDGVTFEILPAFTNSDNQSWTYPNANGGGSWRTCNPRAEMEAIDSRSNLTNRNLKYLCRMMRVWRDRHDVMISGMLIDTLAYQFIANWEHREKSFLYHDFMARDFFAHMAGQNTTQQTWRAPGSGSAVSRKGPFEAKARRAHDLAKEAISYDTNGQTWARNQKWREIFGPLFPS
ncbi:SMODS domain-containing nucleotidyltransferase [Novosphingobium terrae]|uniref:SMODS domain-containing nucleotidyltransferase n=1 Tax=Novosphingobium terrae TaxID=2726189 RepID=UPI001981EE48|nr:nucleotidyltransferase [Novosphingobium terrae]